MLVTLNCSSLANLQCRPVDSLGSGQFPGLLQNSLTSYRYQNVGFFGQATYNLTSQLALTGGIRYTIDKTQAVGATRQLFFYAPGQYNAVCAVDNSIPAPSADNCRRTSSQTSKKPTWLIDLDYKPIPDVLLYAKYARGYRQGNINASNTIPQGWGPEKVDSYEIGAKASMSGAFSGYFDIAAFYNDFSNQQLAASLIPLPGSTASPAQAIVNAGKSRIQGVEVDSQFNYSVFSVAAGYTYLDTKLKSFTRDQLPRLPPRHAEFGHRRAIAAVAQAQGVGDPECAGAARRKHRPGRAQRNLHFHLEPGGDGEEPDAVRHHPLVPPVESQRGMELGGRVADRRLGVRDQPDQ